MRARTRQTTLGWVGYQGTSGTNPCMPAHVASVVLVRFMRKWLHSLDIPASKRQDKSSATVAATPRDLLEGIQIALSRLPVCP